MDKLTKINLNKLAQEVTVDEGGAQSLSIGQVKEVIRKTFLRLQEGYAASAILAAIERQK